MKKTIKHIANYSVLLLALVAVVIFGCRCTTSKPAPDPLAGWTFRTFDQFLPVPDQHHYQLPKEITDDYQDFISTNKLDLISAITGFFEDKNGQRAIQFEASQSNEYSAHTFVLIYNNENKRVKLIKYGNHRFRS